MANRRASFRILFASSIVLAASALSPANSAWAANNCTGQQGGIGGTGDAIDRGGIGGTGDLAQGGGIGGTGVRARDSGTGGTGIVGIITGFASICVNGMEVHYDANTPLKINGRPATPKDLAVGQLVHAEAVGTGDEVVARNISVHYAVSGPIGQVNAARGQMQIMGQPVQVTGQTVAAAGSSVAGLHPGDFVRISGMRKQDGVIVAARVERVAAQAEVSVTGPISRHGANDFSVAGLRIAAAAGKMPEGVAAGREVEVHGQLQNGVLKAERIEVAPALPFGGREQRLELQGYLHGSQTPDKFSMGQTQMEISPQALAGGKLAPDQLVHVSARVTSDRRIVVEHIEAARDYFQRSERHDRSREGSRRETENARGADRKSDQHDHRGAKETTDLPEKPEQESHRHRNGRMEGVERAERVEREERTERMELPERIETPERVERIEKIEIPEKVERVERVERVETPEKH